MLVLIQMLACLTVTLVCSASPLDSRLQSIKSPPFATTTVSPSSANKTILTNSYNNVKGPGAYQPQDFDHRKLSDKYREVEEVTPSNEIDEESREPEISRQPKEVRDPRIPENEPESGLIDPNTPGYAGPPPSAPQPVQPPSSIPPSTGVEYPGIASNPDSPPSNFPTNLFPIPRPDTSIPVVPQADSENQQPEAYYPSSVVPTPPQLYPENFYPSPSPPSTVEIPLPPPPAPQPQYPASVYSSYSPPAWLSNFYTHSVDYYPNYPYSEGLVSASPSYLDPRTILPVDSSQFTSVAPYLASQGVTTVHSHDNTVYLTKPDQVYVTQDSQNQQLFVSSLVNPYSPQAIDNKSTTEQRTITTEYKAQESSESENSETANKNI